MPKPRNNLSPQAQELFTRDEYERLERERDQLRIERDAFRGVLVDQGRITDVEAAPRRRRGGHLRSA